MHIGNKNTALDHVTEIHAGLLQDGTQVLHHHMGLFLHITLYQFTVFRIQWDLPGNVKGVIYFNCLVVGAHRGGRFLCFNNGFHTIELLSYQNAPSGDECLSKRYCPKLINFALLSASETMHILIIDNYDSFTYNLYHIIEAVMPDSYRLTVRRNDQVSVGEAGKYDRFVISPGPGLPADAGISCELIRKYAGKKSILGICLGHQAIAEVFGGKLTNLDSVLHGKAIKTSVTQKNEPLFAGCPAHFETGRYHSWVVDPESLPAELVTTAVDSLGLVMAISHKNFDVKGVQFHPESVMTGTGRQILRNWVEHAW